MSFRETSHVAQGPFGSPDPLRELRVYFELNGYATVHEVLGARPETMTWTKAVISEDDTALESDDEHADSAGDSERNDTPIDQDDDGANDDADREDDAGANDDAQKMDVEAQSPHTANDDDSDLPTNIVTHLHLRRGEKGASLWTSNMAELLADVEVKLIGDTVRIAYKIEDTLQHFTDDDEAFWAHEAKHAIRVATGKGRPIDWRENEEIRVGRQQKDIIMVGVQLAFVAAVLVAIGFFAFAGR